jgi:hypothetical protein
MQSLDWDTWRKRLCYLRLHMRKTESARKLVDRVQVARWSLQDILTVTTAHYEHGTGQEYKYQQPKQIARDSVRPNQAPLWTHRNLTSKIVN